MFSWPFCGSKPSASYFKRDFCEDIMRQKVPKSLKYKDLKSLLPDHYGPAGAIFRRNNSKNRDYCLINMKNAESVW